MKKEISMENPQINKIKLTLFEIELVKPNNEPVDLSNWSSDICSSTTNTQIPNNILIQNLDKKK